jgi:hypothetical protein
MKPRFVASLVVALLVTAGAVHAAQAGYRARLEAFTKEALAQRKQLGLTKAQLAADYPTPEVKFGAVAFGCPGQTVVLKATGQFPKQTAFVYQSDDVEVVKETVTDTSYEAELKVKPNAAPQSVVLKALVPVSLASKALPAFEIGCKHEWTLEFSGGKRLTLRTDRAQGRDTSLKAEGEWTFGGKVLGPAAYRISRNFDNLDFSRETPRAEKDSEAAARKALTNTPAWKDLEAQSKAINDKGRECRKGPADRKAACQKELSDESRKVSAARDELTKKAKADAKAASGAVEAGCDYVSAKLTDGALSGAGERCAPGDGPAVTGTLRSL